MRDEDYREADLDVEVLVDGSWYAGVLEAWVKRQGAWLGHVTYRTSVAQQYRDTVPVDRVRLLAEPDRPNDERNEDQEHRTHDDPGQH